ncbi:hypothetical protein K466DRAFT_73288, partial [Polyporus arcularius HHB13444]
MQRLLLLIMTLAHLRQDASSINIPKNNNAALRDFIADVFIAGSGPIWSTYAKLLVEAGFNVIMCEIGAADSFRAATTKDGKGEAFIPGAHKKNEIEYQKDIDRFVHVINGALSPVSVPVEKTTADTLDPAAWNTDLTKLPVTNGKNPKQSVSGNLSGESVTRGVGGMSTHWTCATPRFHREVELPLIEKDEEKSFQEWQRLY